MIYGKKRTRKLITLRRIVGTVHRLERYAAKLDQFNAQFPEHAIPMEPAGTNRDIWLTVFCITGFGMLFGAFMSVKFLPGLLIGTIFGLSFGCMVGLVMDAYVRHQHRMAPVRQLEQKRAQLVQDYLKSMNAKP